MPLGKSHRGHSCPWGEQGGRDRGVPARQRGRVSLGTRWSGGGGIGALFLFIKLSVNPRHDSFRPRFQAAPALPQRTSKSTQDIPPCPFVPLSPPTPGTSSPPCATSPRGGSHAIRLHQHLAELGSFPLAHQTNCRTPHKQRCSKNKPSPPLRHTKRPPPSSAKGKHLQFMACLSASLCCPKNPRGAHSTMVGM